MNELLFIDDLIKEGGSIEAELCSIVDDGSDGVMLVGIMQDEKKYRAVVVCDQGIDREKAMLLWNKFTIKVELSKVKGVIIMSVLETIEPKPEDKEEVPPELQVKNPDEGKVEEDLNVMTPAKNEERLKR